MKSQTKNQQTRFLTNKESEKKNDILNSSVYVRKRSHSVSWHTYYASFHNDRGYLASEVHYIKVPQVSPIVQHTSSHAVHSMPLSTALFLMMMSPSLTEGTASRSSSSEPLRLTSRTAVS